MSTRLLFLVRCSLCLGAFASSDFERCAKIGERVAGAELFARLVEMEADDRQQRRRGDRREKHDVSEASRPLAGEPHDQVYQRERAESSGPAHVRNEKRIPRAEPRAQRWRKRRSRFGCGGESRRKCFAICEAAVGIADEASIDRGGERRGKTRRHPPDARRSLRRLTNE